MKGHLQFALKCHAALMRLYPTDFNQTFGDEIHVVFSQMIQEAYAQGPYSLIRLLFLEFRDLPIAAVGERLRERRRGMLPGIVQPNQEARVTRWELLIALAAFLIPAGYLVVSALPPSRASSAVIPVMLAVLLTGTIGGLLKRLPRWSLSYLGLVLSAVVFLYLFHWEAQRIGTFLASRFVLQPNDAFGRLLLVLFWEGVVWLSLLGLVTLSILILTRLPHFRPLRQHLAEDWTQLSFLLYNGSILALFLIFEDYRYAEPYMLTALLCLATGAWGYLRTRRSTTGFWAMIFGATLAMGVTAAGMWLLVPLQDWPTWFRWHSMESERLFEVGRVLIGWFWMVVMLALPALTRWLPHSRDPASII